MMNKKYLTFAALVIIAFFLLAMFVRERMPARVSSGKVSAIASFYPLYFLLENIGGDKVDAMNMTPAGVEPHDYELTPRQIARIESGALLVINGAKLEAWGDNVKKNIDSERTLMIVASEGLTNQRTAENGEETVDPHIWLDPLLMVQIADAIADGLKQVDPENAAYYAENTEALKERLRALDAEFKYGLRSCVGNTIITSHAAFGYLADAYGLDDVAIAGISPNAEPSLKDLSELARLVREKNITHIFFEELASPKLAQTLADEVGVQTLVLNPLEGLTVEDIARGKDYITEMKKNLENLQIALQCVK